jgi:hypothetical protein
MNLLMIMVCVGNGSVNVGFNTAVVPVPPSPVCLFAAAVIMGMGGDCDVVLNTIGVVAFGSVGVAVDVFVPGFIVINAGAGAPP